jgi:hypothetical protein
MGETPRATASGGVARIIGIVITTAASPPTKINPNNIGLIVMLTAPAFQNSLCKVASKPDTKLNSTWVARLPSTYISARILVGTR